MATTQWTISVDIDEEEDNTLAEVTLRSSAGLEVTGVGRANRNPMDPDVPEIGDELSTSRALLGLGQDLFEATLGDIEANVGRDVDISV